MPSVYLLQLATGKRLESPETADIVAALQLLLRNPHDERFALMLRPGGGEQDYMQAAGEPTGGWVLEYRDGSPNQHFQSIDDALPLERVAAAFYSYGNGDPSWQQAFEWRRLPFSSDE